MTTLPNPGVSLPDFDAEWRSQEGAARASETNVIALINALDHPSPATIKIALKELTEQYRSSQKLSEAVREDQCSLQALKEGDRSAESGRRDEQQGVEEVS